MTEPVSEVVDARRTMFGRELDGMDGVREWRISIRVTREMGWTSGTPFRKAKVLTWTELITFSMSNSIYREPLTGHCSASRYTRLTDPRKHPGHYASALSTQRHIPLHLVSHDRTIDPRHTR